MGDLGSWQDLVAPFSMKLVVLHQCRNELEIVVGALDGDARTYFNDLLAICRLVLQSLGR